jgi:retron-type reverse transcriptase
MVHRWLVTFIEHRIADRRIVRLIQKWLNAGVLEDGKHIRSEVGSPQGASCSPLAANIYLYYVFDLWAHQWRQRYCRGDVCLVMSIAVEISSKSPDENSPNLWTI